MASLFEEGKVASFFDQQLGTTLYMVNDIVIYFTGNEDKEFIKNYIKKMRRRDISLSRDWGKVVHFRPVETTGGTQNAKFVDIQGACRLILAISSNKTIGVRTKVAQLAAEALQKQIDSSSQDDDVIFKKPQ